MVRRHLDPGEHRQGGVVARLPLAEVLVLDRHPGGFEDVPDIGCSRSHVRAWLIDAAPQQRRDLPPEGRQKFVPLRLRPLGVAVNARVRPAMR